MHKDFIYPPMAQLFHTLGVVNMCETNGRLDGKLAVVTGGGAGIGFEVAKNLARRGARVVIASRNETKLREARDQIKTETGNRNVAYKILDLGSLKSVRNFANEITHESRLDILINNAGAVALPDRLTADGLNLTMQVNFFGAFLLTYLLLPMLRTFAPSRIINGSAASMYIGQIELDHWNDIGRYSAVKSLSNSKLAVALFTAELDRRYKGTCVTANTYDPFLVRDTGILNNIPGFIKNASQILVNAIGQRKEEVGKQVAYLAAAPELQAVSGKHYKFCNIWMNHWLVSNQQLTRRVWEESKKLVQITPDEDWEANVLYL